MDGSCNNLNNPGLGIPQTPYARLLPAKYGDGNYHFKIDNALLINCSNINLTVIGISALPVSETGRDLPLPRILSLILFPDQPLEDPIWNLNAMQWGQIITHDMSLAAGGTQSRMSSLNYI